MCFLSRRASSTLPPSWPHAAASSSPRLARTVTTRPPLINTSRNARTLSFVLASYFVPSCGLKTIKLILHFTLASTRKRASASCTRSLTPAIIVYSMSTCGAVFSPTGNSSSRAATSSSTGYLPFTGTIDPRTSLVAPCKLTASATFPLVRRSSSRISGTRPTVETVTLLCEKCSPWWSWTMSSELTTASRLSSGSPMPMYTIFVIGDTYRAGFSPTRCPPCCPPLAPSLPLSPTPVPNRS